MDTVTDSLNRNRPLKCTGNNGTSFSLYCFVNFENTPLSQYHIHCSYTYKFITQPDTHMYNVIIKLYKNMNCMLFDLILRKLDGEVDSVPKLFWPSKYINLLVTRRLNGQIHGNILTTFWNLQTHSIRPSSSLLTSRRLPTHFSIRKLPLKMDQSILISIVRQ